MEVFTVNVFLYTFIHPLTFHHYVSSIDVSSNDVSSTDVSSIEISFFFKIVIKFKQLIKVSYCKKIFKYFNKKILFANNENIENYLF